MTTEIEKDILYLEVPLAICVCVIYVFVSIGIHYYKATYGHSPWIHESAVSCLFGLLIGGLIKHMTGSYVKFNGDFFFYLILPPIIFSAGFSLKRKRFFQYIHQIALFGIVGTIVNFIFIAVGAYFYKRWIEPSAPFFITWIDAFLLASVLAGSDEVSAMSLVKIEDFPRMGALIFGEGVINDALSIVLFRTFLRLYNAEGSHDEITFPTIAPVGIQELTNSCLNLFTSIMAQLVFSCLIGLSCGLLNALMMKRLTFIRRYPIHQTSLVMLFGYFSYSIAEAVNVSGILTLFIAAITLAHYSWYSLSKSSQVATRISFGAISDIAEGFAFSYVGLSLWKYTGQFNFLFASYMLVVVIMSRVVTVYGLFFVFKFRFESFNIPLHEQTGFILGGIVRGCLCWAQILQVEGMAILVSSTLIIVLSTTLGCGVLLPMVMPWLHVKKSQVDFPIEEQKPEDIIILSGPDTAHHSHSLQHHRFSPVENRSQLESIELTNSSKHSKWQNIGQGSETKYYQHQFPDPINTDLEKQAFSFYLERTSSDAEDSSPAPQVSTSSSGVSDSLLFVKWILFDEKIMKPLFGGSAPDKLRSRILFRTDSPDRSINASSPPMDARSATRPLSSATTRSLSGHRGEILNADFELSSDTADIEGDGEGLTFAPSSDGYHDHNLHSDHFSSPIKPLLLKGGYSVMHGKHGSHYGSTKNTPSNNSNSSSSGDQDKSGVAFEMHNRRNNLHLAAANPPPLPPSESDGLIRGGSTGALSSWLGLSLFSYPPAQRVVSFADEVVGSRQ